MIRPDYKEFLRLSRNATLVHATLVHAPSWSTRPRPTPFQSEPRSSTNTADSFLPRWTRWRSWSPRRKRRRHSWTETARRTDRKVYTPAHDVPGTVPMPCRPAA